jgi:RimJ/RimL family protein N-acetyltransferase
MSSLTKEKCLKELPIREGLFVIRTWERDDLDFLSDWPKYPFPYEGFEFRFMSMNSAARDQLFDQRSQESDTIPLVVDHDDISSIGYLSLTKINWTEGVIGNFGFRIHPAWVNSGIGTSALRMVILWAFDCGFSLVSVDVAASNRRAVRCYEKAGFSTLGEIWRKAQDLKDADLSDTRYDFLRPHLRLEDDAPVLQFFIMEITATTSNEK